MPFEASLNVKTRELLEKLRGAGVEINFEIDETADSWYVEEKQIFKIAALNNIPNLEAMAHELLHVQLSLKGFNSVLNIYRIYNETNSICTADFIGVMNNNLAHFKMLDDFLHLGFNIDDFLQDTPKQYFLDGMLLRSALLVAQYKAGIQNECEQTREIIKLCAGAKLFELYKIKDPATQNGLHPELVMSPLREINNDLIDGLNALFNDWNEADTVDNAQFYYRLNKLLADLKIHCENKAF